MPTTKDPRNDQKPKPRSLKERAARAWIQRGAKLVPLRPGDKKPSTKGWTDTPITTQAQVEKLFAERPELCDTTLAKFHFAATAEEGFLSRMPRGRNTFVVAGCEAHVCVMQTVAGLIDAGYSVKWVADAVGSRHPHNRLAATERARRHGADVVTTEMVIFEWLGTSEHPKFRRLSQLIR